MHWVGLRAFKSPYNYNGVWKATTLLEFYEIMCCQAITEKKKLVTFLKIILKKKPKKCDSYG